MVDNPTLCHLGTKKKGEEKVCYAGETFTYAPVVTPFLAPPVLDTLVPPWTQILVDFLVYCGKRKDREDSAIFQVKMIFPSISPHLPQY